MAVTSKAYFIPSQILITLSLNPKKFVFQAHIAPAIAAVTPATIIPIGPNAKSIAAPKIGPIAAAASIAPLNAHIAPSATKLAAPTTPDHAHMAASDITIAAAVPNSINMFHAVTAPLAIAVAPLTTPDHAHIANSAA